jgi:hypothetical protein
MRKVTHRSQKDKEFLADPSAAKKKYAVENKNYPVDEVCLFNVPALCV